MENLIAGTPLTEEQKRTYREGATANGLKDSASWKLILDWAENRANESLARIRENRSDDPKVALAIQKQWQRDEQWLRDLQLHVYGLATDYEELMREFTTATEFPDREIAVGATAPER